MAIDFMIMPLSRYLAGDFVTPTMRACWAQGTPYSIITPNGTRELPPGVPFGGPDAAARRASFLPMLAEDLALLPPPLRARLWDEAAPTEARFHRVDPASYGALLEAAGPHLQASVFLPLEFEQPFEMSSPFERLIGSVPRAQAELAGPHGADAALARETLSAALADAAALGLPMIVDW